MKGRNLKRNVVIAAILVFVCAAVYLNWSYNNRWGDADGEMVLAEDEAMSAAAAEYLEASGEEEDETVETGAAAEYFAGARLTRQQSRDEALELLQLAATEESASQETIDSALNAISVMATWSMQEAQLENLLLAKDFSECVVFMTEDNVTVAVPSPAEGLSEASVARITETVTAETDYTAEQLKVIEIRADD